MGKLRLATTFSGVGMQERGVRNSGVFDEVEVVATCETDTDAIISYAAIHNGLTMDLVNNYEYPDRLLMAQELIDMNIGYDWNKNKPYDWMKVARSKDGKQLLNRAWLSCKLNKNVGDICKVEHFPSCDMFTYSSPCFVEGTLVLTQNGYKEIQNITEEDLVLTHTNSWKKVIKTMTNEANELTLIKCSPSEYIHCTPNHPFYVRKFTRVHNPSTGISERQFDSPVWVEAKNLSKQYYVGTAINQIEKLPNYDGIDIKKEWGHVEHVNTLSDKFKMPEFWYIIGRFIGDGWVNSSGGIIICGNEQELHQLDNYLDVLGWNYCMYEQKTCWRCQISSQEIGEYCKRFGKGAANKHLTSDILNLPIDLLKKFIEGYMDADGCFTQNKYKLSSVSRELIYEMAQCINKAYHRYCNVYYTSRKKTTVIEGRIVNQKDSYQLTYTLNNERHQECFYEDGYIWSPIRDVEKENYDGLVYNLEVEDDNSYMIQNVIVHNCTDYSIAGHQAGTKVKCNDCGHEFNPLDYDVDERYSCPNCKSVNITSTRSGLMKEVERIILDMVRENRAPKYLLQENVDALVSKKFIGDFENWIGRLDRLGYNTYWAVINGKHCSTHEIPTPQNRKRVFSISIRKDVDNGKYTWPQPFDAGIRLKDILQDNVDEKYYINNEKAQKLIDELVLNGTLTV